MANDNGLNLGPLTNQFVANPFQPNNAAFTNPYFSGGAGQAGSNANLNQQQASGNAIQGTGLAGVAAGTGGEMSEADRLAAIANGSAPSVAQSQLAQNTSQNIGNQMALAAQARGGNPALSAYNAAAGAGNINQEAAGQAATAGIQERNQAAAEAGSLYGGAANTNLGVANTGTQQAETASGQNINQQQFGTTAQENEQNLEANQNIAANQINAGIAGENAQAATGIIGSAVSGAATGLAMGAAQGGVIPQIQHLDKGGMVAGTPAPTDTVHAMLRPGEVVISPEMPEYGAVMAHLNATRGSHMRGAQRIVSSMMKG